MAWGLAHISSHEITEWMAYYSLEPWGEERGDLRAGIVAATVVNAHRVKGRAVKPQDFMPEFDRDPEPDAQTILEKVRALTGLFGGKDLRERR